mgnify:CR=1 FL=1
MQEDNRQALQPLSGNGEALTQSKQQAENLRNILALLAQVKANYPGQELTEETSLMWSSLWMEMATQEGLELLRTAIRNWCARERFLPLPADLRIEINCIKAGRANDREAQRQRAWQEEALALEQRRKEHPEEFFGLADVLASARKRIEAKEMGGFNESKRREELQQQTVQLLNAKKQKQESL